MYDGDGQFNFQYAAIPKDVPALTVRIFSSKTALETPIAEFVVPIDGGYGERVPAKNITPATMNSHIFHPKRNFSTT